MQVSNEDGWRQITRGGQIVFHNLRMVTQVVNKVLAGCLFAGVVCWVAMVWVLTSPAERESVRLWVGAHLISWSGASTKLETTIHGHKSFVSSESVLRSQGIERGVQSAIQHAKFAALGSGGVLLFSFLVSLAWLQRHGRKQLASKHLSGDRLVSSEALTKAIQSAKSDSDLTLGGVPLLKDRECQHILIHGTIGSGKSTAIRELLEVIRDRGDRAIIYDKGGSFLQTHYDEARDKILNPLDLRGANWNLWQECDSKADFENFAAAVIPTPPGASDPFWHSAARLLFSTAACEMKSRGEGSYQRLLDTLFNVDSESLSSILRDTDAGMFASEKIEKTTQSVKSVLATYLRGFRYLADDSSMDSFSLREWTSDTMNNDGGWLYLTSTGDKHEILKPLITAWLDVAATSLLSLPPDSNRRIWFILDELPTLQRVPCLLAALAESRKFGGAYVIGMQNYAQLCGVYGHHDAQAISSLLNTRLMLRQSDPDMAAWSARNLGEEHLREVREGISYGANTFRDGVSLSPSEQRKQIVMGSDILRLPDLRAYLRLPGQFPIGEIQLSYQSGPKDNVPFVERVVSDSESIIGSHQTNYGNTYAIDI